MSYNYSKYQVEIINDILFKVSQGNFNGIQKSNVDYYLNKIYSNKLGHYYNELHFDQYVYFLYQKMQKEELIEIKNSSWITLTQKGRLALSDGYLKYQKTLTPKKSYNKSFNPTINFIKSIVYIVFLVLFILILLGIIEEDSKLIKVLQLLK